MRRSPLTRPLTAVAATALLTGLLAGCTGVFGGGCESPVDPGDASRAVSASGEVGSAPAVRFPTPLIAREAQRTVLEQGDGQEVDAGDVVRASYAYYDGETGEAIADGKILYRATDAERAIGESLDCLGVGSRVVVVGPAGEVLKAANDEAEQTVVAVIDIEAVHLGKADGVNQLPLDGMPTVVTAVDGTPGLALGYQAEVTEARTATIKAGGGATVEEGDSVVLHARSFTWSSATATTARLGGIDSWTSGTPYLFAPSVETMGDENLVAAIIGSTVGSQLLVVIPDEDGEGGATAYVFDILGIDNDVE